MNSTITLQSKINNSETIAEVNETEEKKSFLYLHEIPELKQRSIVAELRRQNPKFFSTKKQIPYMLSKLINKRTALKGIAHWEEIFELYPVVYFTNSTFK